MEDNSTGPILSGYKTYSLPPNPAWEKVQSTTAALAVSISVGQMLESGS